MSHNRLSIPLAEACQENAALRARIAELEKGLTFQRGRAERHLKALAKAEAERDVMRARLAPSLEYCEAGPCGYGDDEIDRLSTRLQDLKLATLAALTQAGICMLEENPITPSEVKGAIERLARNRDTWLKAATELASLRGVLIEFWEATAKGNPDRLEAARMQLMATAGYLSRGGSPWLGESE